MKYLLMILLFPLLVIANLIGGLSAFFIVAAINGYETVMQLLEKANDK